MAAHKLKSRKNKSEDFIIREDIKKIAKLALDNITDEILVLSKDLRIIWANKRILKVMGLRYKDVIGNFCYKITHQRGKPCRAPLDVCPVRKLLKTKRPVSLLHTHFDKHGNELYVEVSVYPIKDKRGRVTELVHISKDVTDRVKAEKALAAAKSYSDNVIKSMPSTLIVVDPQAKIRTVNPATAQLLGYKTRELLGRPASLILADKTGLPFREKVLKKLRKQGFVKNYEMNYKTKNGKKIPVNFSGSILSDERGGYLGIVGIARDLRATRRLVEKEKELAVATAVAQSEKKRVKELDNAYKKLEQMQDVLIQAEKMNALGRLASGVAHEVKNPLATIKQCIDFLQNMSSASKQEISEVLRIADGNIMRADNIIRTLVDFSRASQLKKTSEDINSILGSALILIGHKIKLENIKVFEELEENLPKISVDKYKIEQVFVNLLLNSIQAMPKGGELFIRSCCLTLDKPKSVVGLGGRGSIHFRAGEKVIVVEIEDTGLGISKDNLSKIFDPFFTTKEIGQGVGLGLSVTQNIIQMHKGIIEIKSKIGKGTKVIVIFKI